MDVPVVKKRTRIKVNLTLSPENLNLNKTDGSVEEINVDEKGDDNLKEPLQANPNDEVLQLPKPAPRKIVKQLKTIDEPVEVETNGQSGDDARTVENSEMLQEMAKNKTEDAENEGRSPKPKNNKIDETENDGKTTGTENNKTKHYENEMKTAENDHINTDNVVKNGKADEMIQSKTESKKSGKKKKRKAADVIASVLRKESKQFPKVATILQESEEKDKEDYDVGSPWDSPPAPKSLEKVYIQHKYGFSVRDWCDFYSKPDVTKEEMGNRLAVDVALSFHGLWSRLSIFSHGLVAGIAGCHALAVAAALSVTQSDVPQFVSFYHFLSLKIHFLIYVFTTLCVVSCFDRLDVGQSRGHLKAVGRSHGTLLVTFTYLLCLALSLAAHRHTAAIEAYPADNSLWNAQGLHEWTSLVTIRDMLLLLCWIFMSCSTPSDFLKEKLIAMTLRPKSAKTSLWKLPIP